MRVETENIWEYLKMLPEDRREPLTKLRKIILKNLPDGFEEGMSRKMIVYEVPLSIFPSGYHVDGGPLLFIGLASQKRHVALYHMGLMNNPDLLQWFTDEYAKVVDTKLDMGKSCIRFKNMKKIPYDLIGELVSKMSVEDYIHDYRHAFTGSVSD